MVLCLFVVLALVAAGNAAAGQAGLCNGQEPTVTGTAGRDVIRGTAGADVILALGGNDLVLGRGGNDLICGGRGDDRLEGGRGHDLMIGGSGRDTLVGARGDDAGIGEGGSDRIMLGAGDDFGAGVGGNDVVEGGPGDDTLEGNPGSDVLRGGPGSDGCAGEVKSGCEPLEAGGDMEPGTYRYTGITPAVTVTLGEGWVAAGGLSDPGFVQFMMGDFLDQVVGVTTVPDQVYDPATGELVPLEEDFLTWLLADECIDVISGPAPGSLAGVSGTQVDFTVGTEQACQEHVLWWEEWFFAPGERDRFVVATVEGVEVIIYIATLDPSLFDAFLPTATQLLDTVEFG
jgi:Ca2+-binding RTX toxin-like protein